ncbi:MAG TPA: hypothetical protein PLC98_23385 [Anaerolineales bacterium]|nr:hypothetical protein [Anaerolineales bacterium]
MRAQIAWIPISSLALFMSGCGIGVPATSPTAVVAPSAVDAPTVTETPSAEYPTSLPTRTRIVEPTSTMETAPSTTTATATEYGSLSEPASLDQAILASEDFEGVSAIQLQDIRDSMLEWSDRTMELADYCLWECAKRQIVGENWALTVVLLRAGDADKASRTVQRALTEVKGGNEPYPIDMFRSLVELDSSAWVLGGGFGSGEYRVGASRGSIIVFVTYQYEVCAGVELSGRCEYDGSYLASTAVEVSVKQIEKLIENGY